MCLWYFLKLQFPKYIVHNPNDQFLLEDVQQHIRSHVQCENPVNLSLTNGRDKEDPDAGGSVCYWVLNYRASLTLLLLVWYY